MPNIDFITKEQFDYYIIQKQTDNNIIKSLYEKYFGFFPTLKMYRNFNDILNIYEFCVLNKHVNSNNMLDMIFPTKTNIFDTHKKISTNIDKNKMYDMQKKELNKNNYKEILNELNDTIDKLVGLRTQLKKIMIE
jgi:hypothetical protein